MKLNPSQEFITLNGFTKYRRDTKLKDILNKMFGGDIVMAWSTSSLKKSKGSLGLGVSSFVTINAKGIVTEFGCSEWADLDVVL